MSGGCPGSSATKWASQIFSYIVRAGILFSGGLRCKRPERQIIREPATSIKLGAIQVVGQSLNFMYIFLAKGKFDEMGPTIKV